MNTTKDVGQNNMINQNTKEKGSKKVSMSPMRFLRKLKFFEYPAKQIKTKIIPRKERASAKEVLQKTKNTRFVRGEDRAWYEHEKNKKGTEDDNPNVRIMCMGDMICEEDFYINSKTDDGFDFRPMYDQAKEILKEADLSIANLGSLVNEASLFTGEQRKNRGKYNLNAPIEFLDAVKYSGIDFLAMANNHNLDACKSGLENTVKNVDDFKFMRTGALMPPDERYEIVVIKGIRIAILSYTTEYNRQLKRKNKKNQEILLNKYNREKVKQDIKHARTAGKADFILVWMHWGEEAMHKTTAGSKQKTTAREIADAGADYIVGSKPHGVQEFDIIETENARNVPVAYSLGKVSSGNYNKIAGDTIILIIELEKENGSVKTESKYIPCHIFEKFKGEEDMIVPCHDYIKMSPSKHRNILQNSFKLLKNALGKKIGVYGFQTPQITYYDICDWLGLEREQKKNTSYSALRYPMDAIKGCVAITTRNTANRNRRPGIEEQYEMAEICRKKGAKAVITTEKLEGYNCIVVEDMMEAYITIASRFRDHFSPKTVGITGSIGKTSTTEIINTVIKSKFNTHWNGSSANNIRLASNVVQSLQKQHEAYVQEIMEGPPFGVAAAIAEISKPEIGVVTVIGTSHFQSFGSQERIWESCLGIQAAMPEGKGVMIINGDDPMQHKEDIKNRKVIVYAIDNKEADVRAENIKSTIHGIYFDILFENRKIPTFMKVIGKHNVLNALAAFAAGKEYGMTDEEIVYALGEYRTSGIRQNLISYNGYSIFMDCYNSAYESIVSTVKAAGEIGFDHKKIAVIGDVLELGKLSEKSHKDIGKFLGESNSLDLVIFYGKNAKLSFEECKALGKNCLWTSDEDELIRLLKENSDPGDFLIFKASHGMKLEYVVDRIFGTWNHEKFQRYEYKCKHGKTSEFSYVDYRDHITLTKYLGKEEDVAIPAEIDGVPVTGIGESCFANAKKLHKIHIPENIRNIRYCAFYNCTGLEQVELPDSLLIIGRSAFSTCKNLKKVHLGTNVTDIIYRAFAFCSKLENINIPESCKYIGDEVFKNSDKVQIEGKYK